MAILVLCSHCRTAYKLEEIQLGKTFRCKKCQQTFVAAAANEAAPERKSRSERRVPNETSPQQSIPDRSRPAGPKKIPPAKQIVVVPPVEPVTPGLVVPSVEPLTPIKKKKGKGKSRKAEASYGSGSKIAVAASIALLVV